MPPEPKTCRCCGRRITWRKKWERSWDEVRYCSRSCRARGVPAADEALEQLVRRLLQTSPRGVSDVAVARAHAPEAWEQQVEPARRAARRLVAAGEVELVQRGRVVDPSTARGPVTIRRR